MNKSVSDFVATGEVPGRADALDAACHHLLQSKGKQLRSRLVMAVARFGPLSDLPTVHRAAAAVEMLHLASLAHDDVVDDADLRRGVETAGTRFGNRVSGLAGCKLFAQAIEIISECGDRATALFSTTATRMCQGEMLELQDLYDLERTPERYFAAVEGKTASLFLLAARLGAELAGADERAVAALKAYGHELGVAFQISDDILDLVAGDEATGKGAGTDLRHGVYTLPVIYAMSDSARLREILTDPIEDDQLDDIVETIKTTSGIERAMVDCRRHVEAAKQVVRELEPHEHLVKIVDEACLFVGETL